MANHCAAVSAVIRAARPEFRCRADRVAFAVHAFFLAEGYKLVGVGDDATNKSEGVDALPEVGPEGWNSQEGEYSFLYADTTPAKQTPLLVKCVGLADAQLVVQVLALRGSKEPIVIDLDVSAHTTGELGLMEGYKDLGGLLQRLASGLQAAGLVGGGSGAGARGSAAASSSGAAEPGRVRSEPSSLRDERFVPPPGYGPGIGVGGPLGSGDLYPPGGVPGPLHGGGGMGPLGGGGGMHMGPGDPYFAERQRFRPPGAPDPLAPRPPGGLPPGARYDPIGPPGLPGWNPDDFQRERRPPMHPDVQQPGAGRGPDFDAMFG